MLFIGPACGVNCYYCTIDRKEAHVSKINERKITSLDDIINEVLAEGRKEKADLKVAAKDLPNEAFPPSLVSNTRRSLMHHTPDVTDPYDTASVDVPRLRNALARSSRIDGYAEKAVADAQDHLLWHARQLVSAYLGKA